MEHFKKAKYIHFIGIGGIGISAIARMLMLEGRIVSGSERSESEVTRELVNAGAIISIGQKAENIPLHCDLVIYTVAIPEDNPELSLARHRGIPLLTYPQTLKIISEEKFTIAISGTHGKTTTTAMVGTMMLDAGLEPTILVGSLMKDPRHPEQKGTNFIQGKSNFFVVEADEYKKSFHNLFPTILVINNLDEDHLDFYSNLQQIQEAFQLLAERVPKDGYIICNPRDPHVEPVIRNVQASIIDYTTYKTDAQLKMPGEHNRSNAAVARAIGTILGVAGDQIEKSLQNFSGTWRRFEYKGTASTGAMVYDDYAHNPVKVKAVMQGTRELFPDKKIIIVFQPHLYSRTKQLFNEFLNSFNDADEVLLMPIYAAREVLDPTITSEMLADSLNEKGIKTQTVSDFDNAATYLHAHSDQNTVILTVGAGDITNLSTLLTAKK